MLNLWSAEVRNLIEMAVRYMIDDAHEKHGSLSPFQCNYLGCSQSVMIEVSLLGLLPGAHSR